jgi:hypothetical protein
MILGMSFVTGFLRYSLRLCEDASAVAPRFCETNPPVKGRYMNVLGMRGLGFDEVIRRRSAGRSPDSISLPREEAYFARTLPPSLFELWRTKRRLGNGVRRRTLCYGATRCCAQLGPYIRFCETNPPFFGGVFVVIGYECMS